MGRSFLWPQIAPISACGLPRSKSLIGSRVLSIPGLWICYGYNRAAREFRSVIFSLAGMLSGVRTGSLMSKAQETPRNIARHLSKAFASGNPKAAGRAVGIVVRKKGLATIAKQARLRRESLYRSLSGEFSPALGTVMKLLAVLEMELVVRPCAPPKAKKRLHK